MFESWDESGGVEGNLAVAFELADDIHDALLCLLDFAEAGFTEIGDLVVDRFGSPLGKSTEQGLSKVFVGRAQRDGQAGRFDFPQDLLERLDV